MKVNKTYHSRRAAGLCGQCGNVPSVAARCDGCLEINRERSYATRRENLAAGRCWNCGGDSEGRKQCKTCRQRNNRAAKQRYLARALAELSPCNGK